MTYLISKTFEFSYGHHLYGLPDDHKCARKHGHNGVVVVELEAERTNPIGFVVDYGELSPLKSYLDDLADHWYLNDRVTFNPTAENMARHVFRWCRDIPRWPVTRVGWSETPKTWAYYSEPLATATSTRQDKTR